jgi:hypothetical protein
MANSSEKSWSNNPNAPHIPHWMYHEEKVNLAGNLLGAMFYGMPTYLSVYLCLPCLLDSPF